MSQHLIPSPQPVIQRQKIMPPFRMAMLMAFAIFVCEAGVMGILHLLPTIPYAIEALIDSTILISSLVPFYFWLYRPFWQEHARVEMENRLLSRQLLNNLEEERKRLSYDLHDQCGQTLTCIRFAMDVHQRSIPQGLPRSREQIQDILKMIDQLQNELREIVYQLRPPMLDKIGLVAALKDLVAEISRLHPELLISEKYGLGRFDGIFSPDQDVALYRVCQESLHNAVKYAQASKVSIVLENQGEAIRLTVKDNGIGFAQQEAIAKTEKRQGVGLFGMRERISALNGDFNVYSELGKGTTVMARLPVPG